MDEVETEVEEEIEFNIKREFRTLTPERDCFLELKPKYS